MCQSFRETVMGFDFFGMGFDLAKYNFAKEIINRGEVILENNWRAGEGNMIWDWKIVKTHLSSVKSLEKKNIFILSEILKFGHHILSKIKDKNGNKLQRSFYSALQIKSTKSWKSFKLCVVLLFSKTLQGYKVS